MKQYRTKYKECIIEYMKNNEDHRLCAKDIYQALIEQGLNVNLVTVYRNLDKLSQQGLIQKHTLSEEDSVYYQYTREEKCNHHLHLLCKRCGKIAHLECDFMDIIRTHLLEDHGFEIVVRILQLWAYVKSAGRQPCLKRLVCLFSLYY